MRSPFPGIDPYLEAHWLDVHPCLIVESSNQIQRQLGDDLIARIEERIVVENPVGRSRSFGPDVRVVEVGPSGEPAAASGAVALADPLVFDVEAEPITERFIEIIDLTTGGRVVTVIEFVSPTNKLSGDGREKYQKTQLECRDGRVSLVEVDLTRDGRRELLAHRWAGARRYDSTYQVSVWRASWGTRCELYPIPLRDRLPAIRIPLRPTDADVALDLQTLVDTAYATARYDRTTDYGPDPEPPLQGDEQAWADQLLKAAGRR